MTPAYQGDHEILEQGKMNVLDDFHRQYMASERDCRGGGHAQQGDEAAQKIYSIQCMERTGLRVIK